MDSSDFLAEINTSLIPDKGNSDAIYQDLANKIQDGTVELYDLPIYVHYLTDFFIGAAFLIALIMLVWAGYKYVYAPYVEGESEAKTLLKNIAIGLSLVVFAWMIVDLLIRFLTA